MVKVPQQAIESNRRNKQQKVRTVRQQQVFRTAQNLFFVMAQMRKNCPVKYRAVLEPTYSVCINVLISLSQAYSEQETRIPNLTLVASYLDALVTTIGILRSTDSISRDDFKKAQTLAQSCYSQTMAWRASSMVRVPQGNNPQGL